MKKLKYFLDHPQIKRKKAWGNGTEPKSGGIMSTVKGMFGLGGSQTSGQNPKSKTAQGKSGTSGGTGDVKTNLGNLLSKK